MAKRRGIAVMLVGHVTKDGALAGPRVLEHLVDCVLQFEGERERPYRTVRATKNRFGSTSEAGVFEMRQAGLVEVLDASARFVAAATGAPGSAVLASMEGSRPLLVEVQALVTPSELIPPRRVVNGFDRNRLALVLAVLGRHGGIPVGGRTSSSTSSAASASTSRAPTCRSRSRSRARRATCARPGRVRHPRRRLRRARADRRAPLGRTSRAPSRRGAQVRSRHRPGPAGKRGARCGHDPRRAHPRPPAAARPQGRARLLTRARRRCGRCGSAARG